MPGGGADCRADAAGVTVAAAAAMTAASTKARRASGMAWRRELILFGMSGPFAVPAGEVGYLRNVGAVDLVVESPSAQTLPGPVPEIALYSYCRPYS